MIIVAAMTGTDRKMPATPAISSPASNPKRIKMGCKPASAPINLGPPEARGYLLQQLALAGWTSLPWLSRLDQPTLILAGTRDPIVHVANARLMHRLVRNSRLELVEDGHLFLLTYRDAVAGKILRFLAAGNPFEGHQSRTEGVVRAA